MDCVFFGLFWRTTPSALSLRFSISSCHPGWRRFFRSISFPLFRLRSRQKCQPLPKFIKSGRWWGFSYSWLHKRGNSCLENRPSSHTLTRLLHTSCSTTLSINLGCSPLQKKVALLYHRGPCCEPVEDQSKKRRADSASFHGPMKDDNALCCVIYLILDRLGFLILNYKLYREEQRWRDLLPIRDNVTDLWEVSARHPDSALHVFLRARPFLQREILIKLNGKGGAANAKTEVFALSARYIQTKVFWFRLNMGGIKTAAETRLFCKLHWRSTWETGKNIWTHGTRPNKAS